MNRVLQNGSSFSDISKNNTISMIIKKFENSPSYKEVKFNTSTTLTGVQIVDDSTAISQSNYNSKIIIMKPNDELKVGDIIDDDGQIWLCTLAELYGDIYYTGKITKATHTIKHYDENSILYQTPCVVENSIQLYRMGIDENKYISTQDNQIVVRIQNNEINSTIEPDEIFEFATGEYYKVTNVNKTIESGIIILKMESTLEKPIIPDSPTPPQPILIQGSESIVKGKSAVYIVDYAETVTFSIEGALASIVSQSNNSCTVKAGVELGSVKLWARNNDGSVEGYKIINIEGYF